MGNFKLKTTMTLMPSAKLAVKQQRKSWKLLKSFQTWTGMNKNAMTVMMKSVKTVMLSTTQMEMASGRMKIGIILLGMPSITLTSILATTSREASGKMNGQELMILTGKTTMEMEKRFFSKTIGTGTKDVHTAEQLYVSLRQ